MTYTKVAASSQEDDDDDDAAAATNNYCTTGAGRRSQHSQQPSNGGTTTKTPETTGFSTEAALERLDEDIATLLSEYETVIRHESLLQTVRHFFQHTSDTPLAWFPILLTVATIIALLLTGRPLSGLALAAILTATVYLCAREHSLRRTELHRKVHHVLGEIRLARRLCADWTDANYPNLCSPLSPCVTLQWTYRDGRIVNLPWALLVRDDLVILRPGQVAPAACVAVSGATFGAGETYGVAEPTEPPLKPTARPPLPDLMCRLRETPYLENLRVSLERFVQRPTTIYNLQRYLLVTRYIQVWGSVLTLALTVTIALMRHHGVFFATAGTDEWIDAFVLAPASAVLPILPLVFPALWIAVNLWGIARLQTLLGMPSLVGNKQQQRGGGDALDSDAIVSSATGTQQAPTTGGSGSTGEAVATDADISIGRMGATTSGTASITVGDDDDDDAAVAVDLDTPTYEEWTERPLPRRTVFRCWLALWRGDSRLLGRSANVVQVLGSITALCCVDKKGILSWPNPTAEKVFFLRDAADESRAPSVPKTTTTTTTTGSGTANNDGSAGKDSEKSSDTPATDASTPAAHLKPSPAVIVAPSLASQTSMDSDTSQPPHTNAATLKATTASGAVAEVLDLTHDQHSPFRLAFDDHAWAVHLQSLKPLGLAILVNTCCPLTQAHYAQFCNHVTAVAMLDKDLVPVTNRYEIVESRLNSFMHGRCLCELAKQMGFTNSARDIFQLEGQIASYMHLQPDVVRRDIRFARQLHLASKVKVPFPHCLSVVMREQPGNALQLLTQGTADIVLDCCDDYWDGRDLRPLTAQERKRAQDFYQRSALTAYCTAFAYRPLRHGISGALAGVNTNQTAYLELPPEMRYRLKQQRTPSFTYDSTEATAAAEAARMQQHSISTDSLLRFSGAADDAPPHYRHQYHYLHHYQAPQSQQHQPQNARTKRYTHYSHSSGGGDDSSARGGSSSKAGTPADDDVDSCFEMQCHQVFIGMVTMQYQAQTDIVQLIERLDQACVRFVHFSKENELRSRVFSEKMGLESGWNCHISLLSSSSSRSSLPSPRHSRADPAPTTAATMPVSDEAMRSGAELNRLLTVPKDGVSATKTHESNADGTPASAKTAADDSPTTTNTDNSFEMDELPAAHRTSNDSAMDDENCRSLSSLTVSTEQSAPINFDMSNRAKLPRGIENIQPHLEHVDNVPLLVSLFTDCSAEATREMLGIMQRHGEIVVCLGSSASNANAEIFLQADCGIGVEPLYPQVCQDIAAYTEQNLVGNRRRATDVDARTTDGKDGDVECGTALQCVAAAAPDAGDSQTISPVYLSRTLNSVACSISICRDDSLSIVALIELSRRFSNGLWSCIQFWASCACSLALLNTLCACVALPPVLTPGAVLYVMGVAVPALAVTLVRTDSGEQVMHRATGKKHTQFDSGVFGFVLFCYGCKFIPSTVIMILCYCTFVSHPVIVLDTGTLYDDFKVGVQCAQSYILLAVVVHYVCISTSFVHRDFSIWRKNPASNAEWVRIALCLIGVQLLVFAYDLLWLPGLAEGAARVWPIVALLFGSVALVFAITEICKWEELKVNARAQRRARLDFGTKLGMNSPF